MRILHITAYVTGGAGIAVLRLHQALLDKGIDSNVLCMYALDENLSGRVHKTAQRKTFFARLATKIGIGRNSRMLDKLTGEFEIFTFPFSHYRLEEEPLVQQADIIHLHWISDFVDIPSFFKAIKKPMIWTAHDLNPILGGFHYENDVTRNPQFGHVEKRLRDVKHQHIESSGIRFIASSNLTLEKIREYLPKSKCEVIPCVLDLQGFTPIEKSIARRALNISSGRLILGTGADDLQNHRKGYRILLEAVAGLEDQERKMITIVTFGAVDKSKPALIDGLTEVIRFEPVHDKRFHSLIYSAMDFFVNTSIEETFGLTGTEAILCGTPLIGSATGGMLDYVETGISGELFDPGDVAALRKLIRKALGKKENGELSRPSNCRESLVHWYELNDPVKKHIELYHQLKSN